MQGCWGDPTLIWLAYLFFFESLRNCPAPFIFGMRRIISPAYPSPNGLWTTRMCKFYTGVPSPAVLQLIIQLCSPYINNRRKIQKEDQIILTLMKLRLDLKMYDLACRFDISESTVSVIFREVLDVLATRLEFLISWPAKETVRKNIPRTMKKSKYSDVRCIIDCSELFIERPTLLTTRAQTWSSYKHHNTLKFLIGITPYGSISFLSQCWGGRISDVELTQLSGIIDKLDYGDVVMADRGFTIEEDLAVKGATLVIPPFLQGRAQLSPKEVTNSRKLSKVRIHVERAIGRVKTFSILQNTLPTKLVKHASKIVHVCAALTNLSPKLIN